MKVSETKNNEQPAYGFSCKQAKRLTVRKGNSGYCMIEDREGYVWLVAVVADGGRFMQLFQAGTDGKVGKHIWSRDYKDYKIILDGDDIDGKGGF